MLKVLNGIRAPIFKSPNPEVGSLSQSSLYCVYDLDMAPATFNVFEYLAIFNHEADRKGKEFLLVIVPSELKFNLAASADPAYSVLASLEFRIRNIIVAGAWLFPRCQGVIVLSRRRDVKNLSSYGSVFPVGYSPFNSSTGHLLSNSYRNTAREFASIKLKSFELDFCKQLLVNSGINKDKLVTVTLRRSRNDPIRNSCLGEWAKFVVYAQSSGYSVVVVPDTESLADFHPIDASTIFSVFALQLELRACLYQLAIFNIGVANGPLITATLNKESGYTVSMKIVVANSVSSNAKSFTSVGSKPGENYFWYGDNALNTDLVDSYENIKYCFDSFLRR